MKNVVERESRGPGIPGLIVDLEEVEAGGDEHPPQSRKLRKWTLNYSVSFLRLCLGGLHLIWLQGRDSRGMFQEQGQFAE